MLVSKLPLLPLLLLLHLNLVCNNFNCNMWHVCWIMYDLGCMLAMNRDPSWYSMDYWVYMGSSMIVWSFWWLPLYLCSYKLVGSIIAASAPWSDQVKNDPGHPPTTDTMPQETWRWRWRPWRTQCCIWRLMNHQRAYSACHVRHNSTTSCSA